MAYCPSCGTPVEGNFCGKCGTAIGAAPPPPAGGYQQPPQPQQPYGGGYQQQQQQQQGYGYAPQAQAGMDDNVAGALCYVLGLITGIIFLVLAPYSTNPRVRFHAFQSIFLNIGIFVLSIVLMVVGIALNVIPVLGAILMLVLHLALMVGAVGLWLYMLIKTYNGERIVLPVIGPMAEKQANG